MKRLTPMEKCACALALVFIVGGTYLLIWPVEGRFVPPGPERYQSILGPNKPEDISKRRSQISGGLAIAAGIGISWLAFYRGKK
jgi:uncharacterized protein YjeT (DUF2065 family)